MNKNYNLKLDLQFRCNNSIMKFNEFDNNTSDFFIRVTRAGELIDISKAIVTLVAIKPDGSVDAQFVDIDSNRVYCDLKPTMKNIPGKYEVIASITVDGETVNTDIDNPIIYEVTENKFLRQLNEEVVTEERFTLLTDMINRLSSIETNENTRIENENVREERETLREQAIEKIKTDIENLISNTKKEINDYKETKDIAINEDLRQYKEVTNQTIENYKSAKDTEINNSLREYKSSTDDDIEEFKNIKSRELDDFKNTKNTEIDNYKSEKDLAINKYVENKNSELDKYVLDKNKEIDRYKEAKDKEIDLYKTNKDTLINNKIIEVEAAKQNMVSTANSKISEMDQAKINMQNAVNSKMTEVDNAEQQRQEEHNARETFLNSFESQIEDIEYDINELKTKPSVPVDLVAKVDNNTADNKRQDFYINALFNENGNDRLTIEGEGNELKLEGSKKGLVTVDRVVGNTLINLGVADNFVTEIFTVNGCKFNLSKNGKGYGRINIPLDKLNLFKSNGKYKVIVNITKNTLVEEDGSQRAFNFPSYNYANTGVEASTNGNYSVPFECGETGVKECIITMKDFSSPSYPINNFTMKFESSFYATSGELEGYIMICEYDENITYPINPFEGIQSTFENELVTDEQNPNYGKYKVETTVIGGNIIPRNMKMLKGTYHETTGIYTENPNGNGRVTEGYIEIYETGKYSYNYIGTTSPTWLRVICFDLNYNFISVPLGLIGSSSFNGTFTIPEKTKYIKIQHLNGENIDTGDLIIIKSETAVTEIIPYLERKATVYLNSPLLKGDELIMKEDGLYHYRKAKQNILDEKNDWVIQTCCQTDNSYIIYRTDLSDSRTDLNNSNINLLSNTPAVSWNTLLNTPNNTSIALLNNNQIRMQYVGTVDELKSYLQDNPITIVYDMAEPYYEKISDNEFILDIPSNATLTLDSVIPCQSVKVTYTGNIPSVYTIDKSIIDIKQHNVDMVATTFDMDYRLLEVEWALEDAGITGLNLASILNLDRKGANNMALSRYEQAKIMILGGAYDKDTLTKQLTRYEQKGLITKAEYDELISLMEAKELVAGE